VVCYGTCDFSFRRLLGCARSKRTCLVLAARAKTITEILGSPDDMKFRSSMTLFDAVARTTVFSQAIHTFYVDGKDRATLAILANG